MLVDWRTLTGWEIATDSTRVEARNPGHCAQVPGRATGTTRWPVWGYPHTRLLSSGYFCVQHHSLALLGQLPRLGDPVNLVQTQPALAGPQLTIVGDSDRQRR